MAKAISTRQILKAIGCNNLELFRCVGHGYWYFAYTGKADDGSMIEQ